MQTIKEVNDAISAIIESNREARNAANYILLIENGYSCQGFIHKLVNIAVDKEKEYRQTEAKILMELKAEGNKGKNGEAEVRAKAIDAYSDWQKARMLIDLCYEMINLAKILARGLDNELKSMTKN